MILSNADLLNRFDYRLIGQQLSDNNLPITQANLLSSSQLSDIITDAEGAVISALYVAYKYTSDDLADLDSDSKNLLKRIIADIAFIYICARRGYDYKAKMPLVEDSYNTLQKLRNGERVLNFADNEVAGLTGTSYANIVAQQQAGIVTTAFRYFPLPMPEYTSYNDNF